MPVTPLLLAWLALASVSALRAPGLADDGAFRRQDHLTYTDGASYWDDFYASETEPYEWLQSYGAEDVNDLVEEVTKGDHGAAILHPGCGSSRLPEQMYDVGYHSIANIDISPVVVERMTSRNQGRPGMTWAIMDATNTSWRTGSFDAVIDKGFLDTLFCMDDFSSLVPAYLAEVARILKHGGAFLVISYGEPSTRAPHFNSASLRRRVGVYFELRAVKLTEKYVGGDPHWAYVARPRWCRGIRGGELSGADLPFL